MTTPLYAHGTVLRDTQTDSIWYYMGRVPNNEEKVVLVRRSGRGEDVKIISSETLKKYVKYEVKRWDRFSLLTDTDFGRRGSIFEILSVEEDTDDGQLWAFGWLRELGFSTVPHSVRIRDLLESGGWTEV